MTRNLNSSISAAWRSVDGACTSLPAGQVVLRLRPEHDLGSSGAEIATYRRPAMASEVVDILLRLVATGVLGACIGFERRIHHKAIGIAGMVLIAIGSTTYMLLGRHLAEIDPSAISRTLQGFLSGIGFLGGAVIFKSGFDVKGIKAAAAIWITGALGLAIATSYWWLGNTVGLVTAAIMFVADRFPDVVREEKQETPNPDLDAKK